MLEINFSRQKIWGLCTPRLQAWKAFSPKQSRHLVRSCESLIPASRVVT